MKPITKEAVDALENEIHSGLCVDTNDEFENTALALCAFWREQQALAKESEPVPKPATVPSVCRHCRLTIEVHRIIGNNCPNLGQPTGVIWLSTTFEPASRQSSEK